MRMNLKRIIVRAAISGIIVLAVALATGAAQQNAFTPATANATALPAEGAGIAGAVMGWPIGTLAPWLVFCPIALFAAWLLWQTRGKARHIENPAINAISSSAIVADNIADAYNAVTSFESELITDVAGRPVSRTLGQPLWQSGLWQPAAKNAVKLTSVSQAGANTIGVFRAGVTEAAEGAVLQAPGHYVAERAPNLINSPEVLMKAGVGIGKSFIRMTSLGSIIIVGYDMFTGRGKDIGADLTNVALSSAVALAAGPIAWAAVALAVGTSLILSATGLDQKLAAWVGSGFKAAASIAAGLGNVAKQGAHFVGSAASGIGKFLGF